MHSCLESECNRMCVQAWRALRNANTSPSVRGNLTLNIVDWVCWSCVTMQLPAPKNAATSGRETPSATDSSAYDQALARKKNPKQMAAALFEKQMQAKRDQASKSQTGQQDHEKGDDGVMAHCSYANSEGASSASSALPDGANALEPAAYSSEAVGEVAALPDGWGAAWDASANAYYYYNSAGQTQWEAPAGKAGHGNAGDISAEGNGGHDDPSLPEELRRELKKQAKRGGGQVASLAACAPVVTQRDFWNGEKHQEYTSMAAAFHVPMAVGTPPVVVPQHAPEHLPRARCCAYVLGKMEEASGLGLIISSVCVCMVCGGVVRACVRAGAGASTTEARTASKAQAPDHRRPPHGLCLPSPTCPSFLLSSRPLPFSLGCSLVYTLLPLLHSLLLSPCLFTPHPPPLSVCRVSPPSLRLASLVCARASRHCGALALLLWVLGCCGVIATSTPPCGCCGFFIGLLRRHRDEHATMPVLLTRPLPAPTPTPTCVTPPAHATTTTATTTATATAGGGQRAQVPRPGRAGAQVQGAGQLALRLVMCHSGCGWRCFMGAAAGDVS